MTLSGKVRECVRVIRYWAKHPDEYGSESSAGFEKALRSHLAYAEETGEYVHPVALAAAKKVLS